LAPFERPDVQALIERAFGRIRVGKHRPRCTPRKPVPARRPVGDDALRTFVPAPGGPLNDTGRAD
jgi:hypothetical protein